MSDERIVVNFATLSGASADIATAIKTMNSQIRQLEADAKPLVDNWEGEAQVAYAQRQQQWRASAEHLTILLGDIKNALDESSDRYRHADKTAAGGFQ
jgi:WXG100 family type VII secretion target